MTQAASNGRRRIGRAPLRRIEDSAWGDARQKANGLHAGRMALHRASLTRHEKGGWHEYARLAR